VTFRPLWFVSLCLPLFASVAGAVSAQERADTIVGRVISEDGLPIPMAEVRLTPAGSREQAVRTDADGRFRFVVHGGVGTYRMSAAAFGYTSFTAAVQRPLEGGMVTRDLRLNSRAVALDTLKAVAARPGAADQRSSGERGARWGALQSERFPVDPGRLADVAALEPGISRLPGGGISIAGQPSEQNRATVDGASYGGDGLPSEGVRSVAVLTSTYDVARGQFSGGQIAATTIGGTNRWGGSLSGFVDDPSLRFGKVPGSAASRERQRLRVSGGGGGALVQNRLFVYGALDVAHGGTDPSGLEDADPATLLQLRVAPDSARRLMEIVRGLGAESPRLADGAATDFASALGRVDIALAERHSLTGRLDWRGFESRGQNGSPLRLGGDEMGPRSRGGGVMLQYAYDGGRWAHELRGYGTRSWISSGGAALYPVGRVRVSSDLENGATDVSMLEFGGAPFGLREDRSLIEVAEEVRLATASGHVLKMGALVQEERFTRNSSTGRAGVFSFNSLAELEHGVPTSFTRILESGPNELVRRYMALYLGDRWRPGERLGVTYGLRVEGSRYGDRTELTSPVRGFARSAIMPPDLLASPRVGFSYDLPVRGNWSVDGGAGRFAGVTPLRSLAPRWSEDGAGDLTLTCVGPAAPVPAWSSYRADAQSIPFACGDATSLFASSVPRASVFDRAFRSPRTLRASFGTGGILFSTWGMRLDALFVRGTALPSVVDLNLDRQPAFLLSGEDQRPVYTAPGDLDAVTGAVAPSAARIDRSLGPVRELGSRGESRTAQLALRMTGTIRSSYLAMTYTFTDSRTRAAAIEGFGAAHPTSGDGNRPTWAPTPYTNRHQLHLVAGGTLARRVAVNLIGVFASGLPYTPLVAGDVNGDGYENDIAFISDPASAPDPAFAAALERVRARAPSGARRCLMAQAGRIAGPGSCRTPWSPSLDLRAETKLRGNINTRRLTLAVYASNVTAGLDYLLHGSRDLRGWGQYPEPDAALLQVRGFDAAQRAFRYEVNENFGQPVAPKGSTPFRLTLQARLTLGADPRYQPMMAAVEQGRGRSRASMREDLSTRVRNVPAILLSLAATDTVALRLSAPQRGRLRALADSLAPMIRAVVDSLADVHSSLGGESAIRRSRLEALTQRAAELNSAALQGTRDILTPDQWTRVPSWLQRIRSVAELSRPPVMQTTVQSTEP
jgi:hypothetical protein